MIDKNPWLVEVWEGCGLETAIAITHVKFVPRTAAKSSKVIEDTSAEHYHVHEGGGPML